MAESLGERKQQENIPVPLGLRRKYSAFAGHPRPLWNKYSWSITARQCKNPARLDWIHLSRRFFGFVPSYYSIRSDCWRENWKEGQRTVFFTVVDPLNEPQEDEPHDMKERATSGTSWNSVESLPECSLLDQHEKCSRRRIGILANEFLCFHPRRLCASRLSWKEVVKWKKKKTREILYQKIRFSCRPPLKVTRRSIWQVEHDSTGETCCGSGDDNTRSRFKISSCSTWRTSTRRKSETSFWKTGARNYVSSKQRCIYFWSFDTWTESLPNDTCIETEWLEQDPETHHGIFWRWLGQWPSDEEKHILYSVIHGRLGPKSCVVSHSCRIATQTIRIRH